MDKYSHGIKAEVLARKFLEEKGYVIIDTNVGYKNIGELDIVCMDGKALVVVEVRYRATFAYGHPLETVTKTKIGRIIKATGCYLSEFHGSYSSVRFDIIAMSDRGIEHIENAFFARWN